MVKWNEKASDNNNLPSTTIKKSKHVGKKIEHEFSEELSDGGERNRFIKNSQKS